jgi:phage shock protein PspC (stress-responsive transcriptional regulator)
MREITRIHLAQTPYEIEIDARKILQKYLADVEKTLQADADTMKEIEARIVELLIEQGVTGDKVITTYDVEVVKNKLGEPGEFIDESELETKFDNSEKRLMRDTEDGMLGGVLAGIAAYYDVNVIWLRLAAIVLGLISFGTAFVVYVVLWIIMPATKTVADKLQLRGERVTLESIKSRAGETVSNKTKPLVRILQVILGLGWTGLAALSLAALVFGTIAIVGPASSVISLDALKEVNNVAGWLIASFGLMIVCGILAVVFCIVAAYASFAWKMNKKIGITLVATAVAGVVLFIGAIGAGFYSKYQYDQFVSANTINKTLNAKDTLTGVSSLTVDSKKVVVDYKVSNDAPRVEIQSVNNQGHAPVVKFEKNGDKATLKVEGDSVYECHNSRIFCTSTATITVYGPELSNLEAADKTTVGYDTVIQDQLDAKIGNDSELDITGGTISRLAVNSGIRSHVDTQSAAITNITLKSNQDSTFSFGNIGILTIDSPKVCSSYGAISISAQSVQQILRDGKEIEQTIFADSDCLVLTIYDDAKSNHWAE